MEWLDKVLWAMPYVFVTCGVVEVARAVQWNAETRLPWQTFWEGPWWSVLPAAFPILVGVAMYWLTRHYFRARYD